jgi:uncharacterized OB-fold protein
MGSNSQLQEAAECGVEATYFAALSQGKLMIQRCADCKRAIFYPRQFCPHCDNETLTWEQASGAGTVHSVTTLRTKPDRPYNISLVDLDEGFA